MKFAQELDDEDRRAIREGLDQESLAIFDLMKKPGCPWTTTDEVKSRAEEGCRHVYRVYPEIRSPFYETSAVA